MEFSDDIDSKTFSKILKTDIINSKIHDEYKRQFRQETQKKIDIKHPFGQKIARNVPFYPFVAEIAESNDNSNISSITLIEELYKNTEVPTQRFEEKLNYFKTLFDNIQLIKKENNLI